MPRGHDIRRENTPPSPGHSQPSALEKYDQGSSHSEDLEDQERT